MTYKEFLKKYRLTDKKVGEAFGYSSPQSWSSCHRRKKVVAGIEMIITAIETDIRERFLKN